MNTRRLGRNGPEVSALAMGCNKLSMKRAGGIEEGITAVQTALDAGVTFLDTADFYGMGDSETLIGRAIKGRREQAFLSVKCGMQMSPSGVFLGLDGRPNSVKNFASYSLQRLGVDVIDLYQPGRIDPAVPYEETIGAIADLIHEGKVRHLGVSEVGAEDLRRAHRIHPVAALEIEYSLAYRFIEKDILQTARELGIAIVPYHILADGLLSGRFSSGLEGGSSRMTPPRIEGDYLVRNVGTVSTFNSMAAGKGYSPAQLALAWLLRQGDDIIPQIGMGSARRLSENLQALDIVLSEAELAALDQTFAPGAIVGDRYPAFVMQYLPKET